MSDHRMSTPDSLPTWHGLLREQVEAATETIALMAENIPALVQQARSDTLVASHFVGLADNLARAAVVLGVAACEPAIRALANFVPRAIKQLDGRLDARRAALAIDM